MDHASFKIFAQEPGGSVQLLRDDATRLKINRIQIFFPFPH